VSEASAGDSPPVALVTGAAGGIGRAIVARLEHDGWRVAAATHRGGPLAADLEDASQARSLVERAVDQERRLDLLVVNHAAMTMAPVELHPIDDWWRIVDTNLGGAFFLAQAAVTPLRAARGSIVFISSEWGVRGWPNASAYTSSKAGMIGLTRSLARELAPGVRVNAIAPGVIDTPQLTVDADDLGITLDEMKARYAAVTPLGGIGSPDDVAATVAFLGSAAGGWYTGQVFHPNGGTTMAS
jgi:NAD(P)-dependent dehydrogenase (short-subunit alcohol dehydrogenase family)